MNRLDQETADLILANIDEDEVVELERNLIRIPSYTGHESELAHFIVDYMRKAGIEAEAQEVAIGQGLTSHNAVGFLRGTGEGPSLMFNGHLDTDPWVAGTLLGRELHDVSGWQRDPFGAEVEDGWIYGHGAHNEKGGLTGLIMAAVALSRAGLKPKGDLIFACVCRHKGPATGTLALLERGLKTDYAINTEDSGNGIVPVTVGGYYAKVQVWSQELHWAQKDALPELRGVKTGMERVVRLLQMMGREVEPPQDGGWMTYEPHPGLPGYPQHRFERFEPSTHDHLTFLFGVRTVPGQTPKSVKTDVQRLIDRLLAEESDRSLRIEVEWPYEFRPAVEISTEEPIVKSMTKWHEEVTGEEPDVSARGRSGAIGDACFLHEAGIKTLTYGPGWGHSDLDYVRRQMREEIPPDERISITDLVTATKVYALTAAEVFC